jgi:hypothetical protein
MKKLFLTVGLIAMSGAAFAQGYINFNAGTIPIVVTNTSLSPLFGGSGIGGVSGSTIAGSGANVGAYIYALLISPWTGTVTTDTAVWDSTWTDTGIRSTNSVTSGRVTAGGPAINVGGVANSLGVDWNNGVTNNIVLVGWSGNLGTSWSAVSADLAFWAAHGFSPVDGYFGESAIGYLNPNAAAPGAALFGNAPTANGLPIYNPAANPMELYILDTAGPEPSTLALAGLGGLVLWLFRRRNV